MILFLLCIPFSMAYAQYSCKDCLRDLYNILGESPTNNISIGIDTYSAESLYQGKNDSVIFAAITKAEVFSYGNPLDSVVMLNLGDKALYFMVNTEPPRSFTYSDINSVYDGNGHNLSYKEDYMKFPAIINDPDGFTYVREGPSTKYKVKTIIRKNRIFSYTPIWGSDWCRVYSDDGSLFLGYMYSKRILPYDKCPIKIRKEMEKLMFC